MTKHPIFAVPLALAALLAAGPAQAQEGNIHAIPPASASATAPANVDVYANESTLSVRAINNGRGGADIEISGSGGQVSQNCQNGGAVRITGNDLKVTVEGACSALAVHGSDVAVTVQLQAGAPIAVSGNAIVVTYRGQVGPVVQNGSDNRIEAAP